MKKVTVYIMTLIMLLTIIPIQSKAGIAPPSTSLPVTKPVESAEAQVQTLISRLDEIKAMDKSTMSSPEKKQLREEVRSIKSSLNELSGGGVYISVGAIIVILLLIIILL